MRPLRKLLLTTVLLIALVSLLAFFALFFIAVLGIPTIPDRTLVLETLGSICLLLALPTFIVLRKVLRDRAVYLLPPSQTDEDASSFVSLVGLRHSYLGSDSRAVYFLSEEGIARVRDVAPVLVSTTLTVASFGALVAGGVLGGLFDVVALFTAVFIVLGPVVEESRYRRLRSLLQLPFDRLVNMRGSDYVAWPSIKGAKVEGSSLILRRGPRPRDVIASLSLDKPGLDAARKTLPLKLSSAFVEQRPNPFRFLWKFRYLFVMVFLVEQAIFVAATIYPFFPGEQSQWTSVYTSSNQAVEGDTSIQLYAYLFLNNLVVGLGSFFPVVGAGLNWWVSYNTGRVVRVTATVLNVPPQTLLLYLYQLPHSWIELSSYAVASALGILQVGSLAGSLTTDALDHRIKRRSLRYSLSFVLVVAMLAAAAALEVAEPSFNNPSILWLPFAIGLAAFAIWNRRRKHSSTAAILREQKF